MKEVAVVGLGLIGGSLALALRKEGFAVVGTDASREQSELAAAAGIPLFPTPAEMFSSHSPEVVVICTPVSAIGAAYRECRRLSAGRATTFFHVGGLQSAANLGLSASEATSIAGTHPLAGAANAGFSAARDDLFDGCTVVIERKSGDHDFVPAAMELWGAAGAARFLVEDAEQHDRRVPVVSHLPQLAALALAITIGERGYSASDLGTGGRDATRLANSPSDLWMDILSRSGGESVELLARLQWHVGRLRDAIANEDWQMLRQIWSDAAALYGDNSRGKTK